MTDARTPPTPVRFSDDRSAVVILDQTALPERHEERTLTTVEEVEEAIRSLRVRGAPLIGITAAMGVAALARRRLLDAGDAPDALLLRSEVEAWCDRLAEARPTAVNLRWALARMRRVVEERAGGVEAGGGADAGNGMALRAGRERTAAGGTGKAAGETGAADAGDGMADPAALVDRLTGEATAILDEDREMCRRIGEHALTLLGDDDGDVTTLLTHCNAGALATGGLGTALAPIYLAHARGRRLRVFADETRPLLQGSRLTAWELERAGVDVTVLADSMAPALMATDPPDAVLVGSDRIAANGDVANKIGTYGLALAARHHGVPFYVLAPTSTVDLETATGADIPIEHREADEIRRGFGRLTAPADAPVWSPAFDVTPADLVTAIVTERGVHRPPYGPALREAVEAAEAERRDRSGPGAEKASS